MNFKKQYAALGIPDCPEEAFRPEGKRLKLHGGGGGGGQPANTTQTSIPEYAKPYVESMLGVAQGQTYSFSPEGQVTGLQAYKPYTGQLTAGPSGLQQQSYGGAAGLQTPGQFGTASQIATQGGLAALRGQDFDPNQFTTGRFIDPGVAQSYMSPYMQGVVDIGKREAVRQAAAQGTQRAAKFSQAGAFGGSRQAIADTEANRNLNQQLADLQTRGMQDAYTTGLQAFQGDEARALQAQTAGEQSRQFGANLGLQSNAQALQAAQALGQLGTQQSQTQREIVDLQNKLGTQQQQTQQQALDAQMQQWAAAQNYPYKQLGFISDMLRGLPLSNTAVYQAAPSPVSQLAGLGLAGLGMYNAQR